MEDKRKFERFDFPVVVAIRSASSTNEHSLGLMRNFSYEGLNLVSYDSSFTLQEKLDLSLRFPQKEQPIEVAGNVVWQKQAGNRHMAGIRFDIKDREIQNSIIEKISSSGNIPVNRIISANSGDIPIKKETLARPLPDLSEHLKEFLEKVGKPSLIKKYIKGNTICKVTFKLPRDAAPDASDVKLTGEFNNWDLTGIPMIRQKNGDFLLTLELAGGREYRFKYLIDGIRWENDWHADKYVPNDHGSDDSVVIV